MELSLKTYNINYAWDILASANKFLDEYKVIQEFILVHHEEFDVGEIWAVSNLPEEYAKHVREIGILILQRMEKE